MLPSTSTIACSATRSDNLRRCFSYLSGISTSGINRIIWGQRWFGVANHSQLFDNGRRASTTTESIRQELLTLDPTKLVESQQQAVTFGNTGVTIYADGEKTQIRSQNRQKGGKRTMLIEFPKVTGFFYYHRPNDRPLLAGELRFRVTPTPTPTSFPDGHDMRSVNQFRARGHDLWSLNLPRIVSHKCYKPLLDLLQRERLVPKNIDEYFNDNNWAKITSKQILFALSDPFYLSRGSSRGFILTENAQSHFFLQHVVPQFKDIFSSGSMMVRFERSSLPEHEGEKFVVLRCLEIVEPYVPLPTADPAAVVVYTPVPGQLLINHKVGRYGKMYTPAWAMNISKPKGKIGRGLSSLW